MRVIKKSEVREIIIGHVEFTFLVYSIGHRYFTISFFFESFF